MQRRWRLGALVLSVLAVALTASVAGASTASFSNQTLFGSWDPTGTGLTIAPNPTSSGDSEPAIAFGSDGSMAVDGLAWLPFQVNVWRGTFGSTPPDYLGGIDTNVPIPGKGRIGLGSGDADIEIAPDGTVVVADLDFVFNKNNKLQLGVSITRCPPTAASPSDCTTQVLDQSGADRPWLTHSGDTFYLTYHDSGNSASIHALRSDDDGVTWKRITSPLTGQGPLTGQSTFNNIQGPIVADPNTPGLVYDIYASGETKTKCCSADFNNIIVSRSTDGGKSWTAQIVYHAPVGTVLDNIFPSLAVDQTTSKVYAVWSDGHDVSLSSSPAGGTSWAAPETVSDINTALMPWVAARAGKVDVVYYGSTAKQDDPAGMWNVYDSQSDDAGATFDQNLVSDTPNRKGAVCTEGTGCEGGVNRELLDLFEVAEDPISGKAAIVYTSSEISTYTTPDGVVHKLPEIVLAYEQ